MVFIFAAGTHAAVSRGRRPGFQGRQAACRPGREQASTRRPVPERQQAQPALISGKHAPQPGQRGPAETTLSLTSI